MPPLPLNNGAQVELVHQHDGAIAETTVTARHGSAGLPSSLEALGAGVSEWWVSSVLPHLSVELTYIRYQVTDLEVLGPPVVVVEVAPGTTGGEGGGSLPANVALRVNLHCRSVGRRRSGAAFVPGIPKSVAVRSEALPFFRDAIQSAYQELGSVLEGLGWSWVVQHNYRRGVLLPAAESLFVVAPRVDLPYLAQRRSRLHNEPT